MPTAYVLINSDLGSDESIISKIKEILKKHKKWLMSIGIRFDKRGNVINNFKGYPFPDLSTDNSIPVSYTHLTLPTILLV